MTTGNARIVEWHLVSNPPDADLEVMIGTDCLEVYLGFYDDEDKSWHSGDGTQIYNATYWAEVPEVPNA